MEKNTRLSTLIFDVDGTLADTEREGHRVAFNRAFEEVGLPWHWSEKLYGALLSIAGGKERIRFFMERYRPPLPVSNATKSSTSSSQGEWGDADLHALVIKLHQLKTAHYSQLVKDGAIHSRPGVVRLIHEARESGLRLAIATTSAPENAIALLQAMLHLSAPEWFEVIAAGDIVANKKPAPDIYQYVLHKMTITPEECLVFEDSEHGLQAAVSAGLPTIVTENDYTRTQDFSSALLVVNHLGEPDCPSQAIAHRIDLPTCFTDRPTPYIDVACLRDIHQRAAQLSASQSVV